MKGEPAERLDPRAKTLWRITGALNTLPLLVGAGFGSWALLRLADTPFLIAVLPVVVVLALGVIAVGV
ncbi:MAG: PH domain-containing protein, partial [Rubrobacter sp.]